ncbi:MAG: DUF3108 domain-containing protein [Desulfobacterales bacterium]
MGSLAGSARAMDDSFPFQPGERLTFRLRWSFVPAGEAILEVLPLETLNGQPVLHFVMTVKTNAFVDAFYKVRDRIDAYTDAQMTHTVLYKKHQHEGNTRRDVVVTFDWENNQAHYAAGTEKRDPIAILPGSFDPLSIFYRTRMFDFRKNRQFEHPLTDGKKSVIAKATVVKREKIRLPSGTTDVYVLEPDLKHVGGVFKKSRNARIRLWLTADDRKILVRIKSKVAVGSFVGELISAEGLRED